jgi:hypothetical protein
MGLHPTQRKRMAATHGTLWRRPIPPIDKRSAKSFIRTNERIRAREIRVIDEHGEQLGIMAPFDALKMARERSLDLVEISPNAVPPVCRIQDYGKFLYEKDKSERAARKKQKVIVIKEVKFSVTVDEHDYQTKKNMAVHGRHDVARDHRARQKEYPCRAAGCEERPGRPSSCRACGPIESANDS